MTTSQTIEEATNGATTGTASATVFGATFGALGHVTGDGKRDFVSDTSIAADRYEVQVNDRVADEAERLLGAMPGGR